MEIEEVLSSSTRRIRVKASKNPRPGLKSCLSKEIDFQHRRLAASINRGSHVTEAEGRLVRYFSKVQSNCLAVLCLVLLSFSSWGREESWDTRFGEPGLNNQINTIDVSGSGRIAIGGSFLAGPSDETGEFNANRVAIRDGELWSRLGEGLGNGANDPVNAVLWVGDELYVGGDFTAVDGTPVDHVARWDGESWGVLASRGLIGVAGSVYALASVGSDVYVGGRFGQNSAGPDNHVARWNGTTWSSLTSGVSGGSSPVVLALAEGPGESLIVGGKFLNAGEIASANIAIWSGSEWASLGDGIQDPSGIINAIAVSPAGEIVVGGEFLIEGDDAIRNLAIWNGTNWQPMAGGVDGGPVHALAFVEDALWVGGAFHTTDGEERAGLAVLREGVWETPGESGLRTQGGGPSEIRSISVLDDVVYLVGNFERSANRAGLRGMAVWNGSEFQALHRGFPDRDEYPDRVSVAGTGAVLTGSFESAGGEPASRIVRWTGEKWDLLGTPEINGVSGRQSIHAVATDKSGTIYIGGNFSEVAGVPAARIAKWDGTAWSAMGAGMSGGQNGGVRSLALTQEGELYAGGTFTTAGGLSVNHVARWYGEEWSPLGDGLTWSLDSNRTRVHALHWDGDRLYAGGSFDRSGQLVANSIAWWDGSEWHALDEGLTFPGFSTSVQAIRTRGFDVFAGGTFSMAGVSAASNIARWTPDSGWRPLGAGFNSGVDSLVFHADRLFAAGNFTLADDLDIAGLAQWNGSAWSTVAGGLKGDYPYAVGLAAETDKVYVVGRFERVGTVHSPLFAILNLTNAPPVVSWNQPALNQEFTVDSAVVLSIEAEDFDGAVESVTFFNEVDEEPLVTLTGEPWEYIWPNPGVGHQRVAALVKDNMGATSWSLIRGFDVVPPDDNLAPQITIISPEDGDTFKTSTERLIVAEATDADGSVASVEFFSGNAPLGLVESPPWEIVWPGLEAGEYQLRAVATDNAGATTASEPVGVTVLPPNSAPFISVGSPDEGEVIENPETLTLRATCSDGDGGIDRVEFFVGETLLAAFDEEDPTRDYTYVWDSPPFGEHVFRVVATDSDGATSELRRNFSVVPFNEPPTIELFGPDDGAVVGMPNSIPLTVEAEDPDGDIAQVEWLSFDLLIGSKDSPPWVFNLRNLAATEYSIRARATDNLGKTAVTPSRLITVTNNQAAQPRYRLIELVIPGGKPIAAYDINDLNKVACVLENGNREVRGFLWSPEASYLDIGDAVVPRINTTLECLGINNQGVIVGNGRFSGRNEAFLWDGESVQPLGILGEAAVSGSFSRARAVNDPGWVVGVSGNIDQLDRAFLYREGEMTDLGALGEGLDQSEAFDVNDNGQVVGWVNGAGGGRAFIFDDAEGMRPLSNFAGGYSKALAINNRSQVVGQYEDAFGDLRAFLWSGGVEVNLGTLGGFDSLANDINEKAQIVGSSDDLNFESRAFLWQNCAMFDLNLSITNSNWRLVSANAINEAGWIVGVGEKDFGTEQGVFVLVPEEDNASVGPVVYSNGLVQLCVPAPALTTYRIEASDDLEQWVPVSTNYVSEGVLDFHDTTVGANPNRFYRATEIPPR